MPVPRLLLGIVALASSEETLVFFFSEAMNVLRGRVVPLAPPGVGVHRGARCRPPVKSPLPDGVISPCLNTCAQPF